MRISQLILKIWKCTFTKRNTSLPDWGFREVAASRILSACSARILLQGILFYPAGLKILAYNRKTDIFPAKMLSKATMRPATGLRALTICLTYSLLLLTAQAQGNTIEYTQLIYLPKLIAHSTREN